MRFFSFIFIVFSFSLYASTIKVASVAGYKKPMMQIKSEYEKGTHRVDIMFGNIQKSVTQAKNGDVVMVVGDKQYLNKKSGLDIKKYITLGEGKLVLAYAKGVDIKSVDDLKKQIISRVAIPHSKKSIYGNRAKEFFNTLVYKNVLEKKIYEVATIPQVVTYLVTKEVDAGFINLTAALNNKDKIGGYIVIDKNLYSPIEIVAATLNKQNSKDIEEFERFLESDYSKAVFVRNGL